MQIWNDPWAVAFIGSLLALAAAKGIRQLLRKRRVPKQEIAEPVPPPKLAPPPPPVAPAVFRSDKELLDAMLEEQP